MHTFDYCLSVFGIMAKTFCIVCDLKVCKAQIISIESWKQKENIVIQVTVHIDKHPMHMYTLLTVIINNGGHSSASPKSDSFGAIRQGQFYSKLLILLINVVICNSHSNPNSSFTIRAGECDLRKRYFCVVYTTFKEREEQLKICAYAVPTLSVSLTPR